MPLFFQRIYNFIQRHPAKVGSLAGWFQQACSAGAAILLVPILLRLLPKDQAGIWFSFQGFVNIANLADFGFGFAIARQVAYCMGQKEGKGVQDDFLEYGPGWLGVRRLMDHSNGIYTRVILIAAVLLILIFEIFLPLTKLQNATETYRIIWYLMATAALTILSLSRFNALLIGLNHLYIVRLLTGLFFLFQGSLVALVAYWTRSLPIMALVSLLVAIANWLAVRTFSKILARPAWEISRAQSRFNQKPRLFRIAAPMGLVNSSAYLISSIQVPLIGALLGPVLVAPYYLAQKIGLSFNMIAVHLIHPRLPIFTRLIASEQNRNACRLMLRTLGIAGVVTLTANILYLFGYPELVTLLAGKHSLLPWYVIILICIDSFVIGITSSTAQFVLASGINPFVISSIIYGLLNVLLIWVFIPIIGLSAVPLSSIVSGLFTNTWLNLYCGIRLTKNLKNKSIE